MIPVFGSVWACWYDFWSLVEHSRFVGSGYHKLFSETQVTFSCATLVLVGLSLDNPINFDILFVNTFITQLPIVFGELSSISLAGVFERRFVVSISTFKLWLRETIIVFRRMIWGTDSCLINNTFYSHAMSFQRAVFRFITVAGTWWGDSLFLRLQDLMGMTTDDWSLITQLPVGFGEHSSICLAGVFERRFVVSIATFKLWLRETILVHVFLRMIWGTDSCFINYTFYSHAMSFQRAVFRFITVVGTWWGDSLFLRLQDLMIMTTDDWSLIT